MEGAVYLLCAATAFACSLLMLRGWKRTGLPLLLAVAVAFAAFAAENGILFLDIVVYPHLDLAWPRTTLAFVGVLSLLFGCIWGTK